MEKSEIASTPANTDDLPELPKPQGGGRGRPRSESSKTAVLSAAYQHAAKEGGCGATIEAIAKSSGVSKVTIYKWWSDRQTLLTDAFLWHVGLEIPLSAEGDPVQAIHQHAARYVSLLGGDVGRVLKVVLSECLTKSGDTATFFDRYLKERRELGTRVIEAGQRSGAIRSQRPAQELYDQIYGTIFYRFIFDLSDLNPAFVRQLVDDVFCR
ncbi:TetR/AcrR family transcriptional regulator [Paraburkholderia hiiakae]|uniref:TetR/AcrR family transcriptional regulator n=1 Tax=Paraburkholderia hiiakae TaxID=1081782 RepID=UPI001919112D|nr:TetR/AcrR family transcriptional regulator C-terminal ligand-binding domain-containing protein [Paraburkholderia hiiakae]